MAFISMADGDVGSAIRRFSLQNGDTTPTHQGHSHQSTLYGVTIRHSNVKQVLNILHTTMQENVADKVLDIAHYYVQN